MKPKKNNTDQRPNYQLLHKVDITNVERHTSLLNLKM